MVPDMATHGWGNSQYGQPGPARHRARPGTKMHNKSTRAGLLLLRDEKDFQSFDNAKQTLSGPYTAVFWSLCSKYTGCADWRMPDFGGKS